MPDDLAGVVEDVRREYDPNYVVRELNPLHPLRDGGNAGPFFEDAAGCGCCEVLVPVPDYPWARVVTRSSRNWWTKLMAVLLG